MSFNVIAALATTPLFGELDAATIEGLALEVDVRKSWAARHSRRRGQSAA